MNSKEFNKVYKDREIRVEISLLQYFRDIVFYTILSNIKWSSHRKVDLNAVIHDLGTLVDEHPECKTFGDLKRYNNKQYNNRREDIIRFIEKFHYSP